MEIQSFASEATMSLVQSCLYLSNCLSGYNQYAGLHLLDFVLLVRKPASERGTNQWRTMNFPETCQRSLGKGSFKFIPKVTVISGCKGRCRWHVSCSHSVYQGQEFCQGCEFNAKKQKGYLEFFSITWCILKDEDGDPSLCHMGVYFVFFECTGWQYFFYFNSYMAYLAFVFVLVSKNMASKSWENVEHLVWTLSDISGFIGCAQVLSGRVKYKIVNPDFLCLLRGGDMLWQAYTITFD